MQGCKDVGSAKRLINSLLKRQVDGFSCGEADQGAEEESEYKVHMAVLTATLGKRMPIIDGNMMSRTLEDEVEAREGSVYYMPRHDEVGFFALWFLCGFFLLVCCFVTDFQISDVQQRRVPDPQLACNLGMLQGCCAMEGAIRE